MSDTVVYSVALLVYKPTIAGSRLLTFNLWIRPLPVQGSNAGHERLPYAPTTRHCSFPHKLLYIYIYMHICAYICIYVNFYKYVYIYKYIHVYVCIHMYIYVHIFILVYAYILVAYMLRKQGLRQRCNVCI